MNHYVYKLEDTITKEFYIGSRSCKCKIEDDTYMGSYKTWKPEDKSRLVKFILNQFSTRLDANEYEFDIINENIDNPLNRNYHNNKKFCTYGTIRNITHHMLGKSHSAETKLKISKNNAKYWKGKSRPEHSLNMSKNPPMLGKSHSNETKQLQSLKANGRYTKQWFIDKYGNELGIQKYNDRSEFLSKRNKLKYKDKTNHPNFGKLGINNPLSKVVYQYTKDGTFIKKWPSLATAARELGIHESNISSACNGKLKTYKGFIWTKVIK